MLHDSTLPDNRRKHPVPAGVGANNAAHQRYTVLPWEVTDDVPRHTSCSPSHPVPYSFFVAFFLCLAAGAAFATAIGDQVELKAANRAGVPLHQEPRGTNNFQRIPDGTRAHVIDVAKGGQWLKLSLPDGRTGWVTSRYVNSPTTSAPSLETSPAVPRPQRIEEGIVERVADDDPVTVTTANQTKLRIRMVGILARVSHFSALARVKASPGAAASLTAHAPSA